MVETNKPMPDRKTAISVVAATVAVIVLFFSNPFSPFSASDVSKIRSAQATMMSACRGPADSTRSRGALDTLISYYERNATQPIALRGNVAPTIMRDVLLSLEQALQARLRDSGNRACVDAAKDSLRRLRDVLYKGTAK